MENIGKITAKMKRWEKISCDLDGGKNFLEMTKKY